MSFDFGADPIQGGGNLKQASEGQHEARLLGLIHLGMYADEYPVGSGKFKDPAPFVCALFELKSGEEGGGLNEDGTPIVVHKSFPLKRGDKAFLTRFMKVFLTVPEFKQYETGTLDGSFDDFISRPVMIDMKGGKKMNDDGTPQYTNVDGITKMPDKLAKICEDLELEPVGHIPFDQIGEKALKSIPPFEIYGKLEKSINFPGSSAESALAVLRKEDPDFGTKKDSDSDKKQDPAAPPERKRDDLDESEDFS